MRRFLQEVPAEAEQPSLVSLLLTLTVLPSSNDIPAHLNQYSVLRLADRYLSFPKPNHAVTWETQQVESRKFAIVSRFRCRLRAGCFYRVTQFDEI